MENSGENLRGGNELIRLYVLQQVNMKDFHEVTPNQLEQFITECKEKNDSQSRNLYHQLGIVAKVDKNTTKTELDRLLQNEVRTLLVQTKCNKPQDLEQILLKINTSADKFYRENIYRTPIGIAVEINGELLTTGRLRNDDTVFLEEGHVMLLTTSEDYKYCCFKEIIYVSNLWRYLAVIKLGDVLCIDGGRMSAKVVKNGCMRSITVEVLGAGLLCSYMNIEVPYYIEGKELNERAIVDVESAIQHGAHFLVIPGLRSAGYVSAVRQYVGERIKLIGSIDFQYLEKKFIDIADHLLELDAIWIDNLFSPMLQKSLSSAIKQAVTFEKAIIGSVPLKSCSDFKKLESHDQLKKMDCLLIEKSSLRKQFPLIVKKLLPVTSEQIEVPLVDALSCRDGIVNFVLRTIYSIPCKGIVVSNICPKAAIAFAIPQIYCPVIAVVKNDDLARLFNLRRNIKSVVYGESNAATEHAISYGRKEGLLSTGDFVISIFDSMDENSQICVNLRAYYLPPNELV